MSVATTPMDSRRPTPSVTEALEAVRSVLAESLDRPPRTSPKASACRGRPRGRGVARAGRAGGVRRRGPRPGRGRGPARRETGARAVQLPVLETLCCGVLTRPRTLPGAAAGAAARRRPRGRRPDPCVRRGGPPAQCGARDDAYADGTVTGRKIGVTYADGATRLLVTATQGRRPGRGAGGPERPAGHPAGDPLVVRSGHPHRRPRRRGRRAAGEGAARTPRERYVAGRASPRPAWWPVPGTLNRCLHQGPDPVRALAGRVPGRGDADRRRLHLLAHRSTWPPRTSPGGLQHGPRRVRRPGGRRLLGVRRGAARPADLPPPARGMGVDVTYPLSRYSRG